MSIYDEDEFRDMPVTQDEKGNWIETEEGGVPVTPAPRRPRSTGQPPAPAAPARPQRGRPAPAPVAAPELQYDVEAIESEEEDDFTAVLSSADLRLDQGALYKMIMNSNLFENVTADPRAVKYVEREIKRFARERMEVTLGMRPERQAQPEQVVVSSPFNALEVQVLKQLASTVSKGVTESPQAEQVAQKIARKEGINPISGGNKPQATLTPAKPAQVPARPLAKPVAPLKRTGKTIDLNELESKNRLNPKIAEQVVDQVMDGTMEKDLSEMSEDEIIAHNNAAAARRTPRATNPQAVPMPTLEQANYLQQTKAANMDPKMQNTISTLMTLMSQKK